MATIAPMSGPIPGENYTSDTKNYAWHRPPDFTNLDKAIDDIGKTLLSKEGSAGLLTMLDTGVDVVSLTSIVLLNGIGKGKWTPDMAILLAGPTSHLIKMIGEADGLKVNMGLDDSIKAPTKAFFDGIRQVDEVRAQKAAMKVDTSLIQKPQDGGLMDMPVEDKPAGLMTEEEV